jgi:hypothetical protein
MLSLKIWSSQVVLSAALAITVFTAYRSDAQQPPTVRANQRRSTLAGQSAGGQTMSPIASAHATFERAAKVMESALPIYDGHRHRAIQLARLAAREIKEAAMGRGTATGSGTGTGTSGAAANVQRKTAAQQAAAIPKGSNTPLTNYNSAQIAASNAKMQQGLQLLQQGLQQVQAIGNDSGNHMKDALEFGNYSIEAANKGLAYVQGKM